MTEEEFLAVLKLIDSTATIGYSSVGAAGVVTYIPHATIRIYAVGRSREECVQGLISQFEKGVWDEPQRIRGVVGNGRVGAKGTQTGSV